MATKNSLSIRLTEAVVFLRTADSTSRRHLVHGDSPPSMVRGLLILELTKPTRISSIELELQGKASNNWSEGIGTRNYEVTENHIVFFAKTVFFTAASAPSRRTASVGPGLANHDDDHLEWDDDTHHLYHRRRFTTGALPADHDHNNGDTVTPQNDLVVPTASEPRGRRPSLDNSIFQRDFASHHENLYPSPPPSSPSNLGSPHFSSSLQPPESNSFPPWGNPRQHSSELQRFPRSRTIFRSATSSRSPSSDVANNEPGPSHLGDRFHRFASPSRSRSRSHSRTSPQRAIDRPPSYREGSISTITTSHNTSVSLQDTRGRNASRFSLTGISNLLGAIGERTRSRSRSITPTESSTATSADQRAHRYHFGFGELFGDEHKKTSGDGWKEFKKGTYTYPISFTIPGNSPPTLHCDYGSVNWRLKAHVHRPGAFRFKLTAMRDVAVISYPVLDDAEEQSTVTIERQWENQLQYLVSVASKMFHIGGVVPISFVLMPLGKIKIHRLLVFIEERVDYLLQMNRTGRTDPIGHIQLLSVKHPGKEGGPILPLDSDDANAFRNSPLYTFFESADADEDKSMNDERLSETASSLMGPGPWTFSKDLKLPDSCSQMRFTNANKKGNILVTHILKVVIRVERGDDREIDLKTGRRKQFDIIMQMPVHILSCRCKPEWISLPGYTESFHEDPVASNSCPCTTKRVNTTPSFSSTSTASISNGDTGGVTHPNPTHNNPVPSSSFMQRMGRALERIESHDSIKTQSESGVDSSPVRTASGDSLSTSPPMVPTIGQARLDTLLHRNELFERLVAGQISENGEAPPAYTRVNSAEVIVR